MQRTTCPLCNQDSPGLSHSRFDWYHCQTCGEFGVPMRVDAILQNETPARRAALSAFTRELTIRGDRAILLIQMSGPLKDVEGVPVEINYVMDAPRLTVAERLDRTLVNLAKIHPKVGARFEANPDHEYPLSHSEDRAEFLFFLNQLHASGLLRIANNPSGPEKPREIELTVPGWNRIADLQRATVHKPDQTFVAMAFDASLAEVRNTGLKEGIEAAGYKPLLIDETQYNTDIHDQILSEIRKSRFVVADFTLQKRNVYFEAGFAEALGLQVIYTCRDDDIMNAQFDIRQRNHIVWLTPDELREKLKNRIGATIGPPHK